MDADRFTLSIPTRTRSRFRFIPLVISYNYDWNFTIGYDIHSRPRFANTRFYLTRDLLTSNEAQHYLADSGLLPCYGCLSYTRETRTNREQLVTGACKSEFVLPIVASLNKRLTSSTRASPWLLLPFRYHFTDYRSSVQRLCVLEPQPATVLQRT